MQLTIVSSIPWLSTGTLGGLLLADATALANLERSAEERIAGARMPGLSPSNDLLAIGPAAELTAIRALRNPAKRPAVLPLLEAEIRDRLGARLGRCVDKVPPHCDLRHG